VAYGPRTSQIDQAFEAEYISSSPSSPRSLLPYARMKLPDVRSSAGSASSYASHASGKRKLVPRPS
jgi:hypothetical protein